MKCARVQVFFYKVYFWNGFWSDMIHLPFGKASSLDMGRSGDGAWWVTEGCFLGWGPWCCVGPGPFQTSPQLLVLQEAWGNQEARPEMWSGLSMSVDHRPHNPWWSFICLGPFISVDESCSEEVMIISGYWLPKLKSQTSALISSALPFIFLPTNI